MAAGLPANKKFTVCFTRPKGPWAIGARLIMKVLGSTWSHAAIELVDPATKLPLIFQATGAAVNFYYLDKFLEHNEFVHKFEVQVTPLEYIDLWGYSLQRLGSDYSYKELLNIFTQRVFRIKSWFKDDEKSYICSELVARVLRKLGQSMPEDLDSMDPKTLFDILNSANSGTIRRLL